MLSLMLLVSCLISFASADLRMSSHPRNGYGLNIGGSVRFNGTGGKLFHRYMIPSIFAYTGLKYPGGQKYNNYDNFLRSNIDNEQDNRNFDRENGEDHLPFRTLRTTVDKTYRNNRFDGATGRTIDLRRTVKPGESLIVPLRWNNPHAAELEVNVWIFDHSAGESRGTGGGQKKHPIVIPIRKPTCSGEGHQDNAVIFTIPKDFTKLGSKIPGFKGCNTDSEPMCSLQVYSHSVESRQYALAFPIVIPGHEGGTTTTVNEIEPFRKDPWMEIYGLRELCLPSTDISADIVNAAPRWARLVSDVYTHSYMNSDFSPYSGQQQEYISQNLQTSAVNKMVTGNRGELGRSILTREQYSRIRQLSSLEDTIYKNYEALANKIIKRVGNKMQNQGYLEGADGTRQGTAQCFRCGEVGSTTTRRQETNTYIPSFQLPGNLVAEAKRIVPSKYASLITRSGVVQIYRASLLDLAPFFFVSHPLGIIYQDAELKDAEWATCCNPRKMSISTKSDATNFKKQDANGNKDKGVYASTTAKLAFAKARGCPSECIYGKVACPGQSFKPLFNGASNTCVSGATCSKCSKLYDDYQLKDPPAITPLARLVAKSGLPAGMGEDQLAPYPDTDGSPRFGRPPPQIGGPTIPPANRTWDLGPRPPAPAPATEPPTSPPTPAPPTSRRRRRRRVSTRRRRRKSGKGGSGGRRRSGSRRRRGGRRRRGSSLLTKALRGLDTVLGDVEPLPEADDCH